MKRYVCIHGHFYQPPRENAWIDAIETQDSASPFHDWNERITDECYGPNAAARILNPSGEVERIQNNYSKMSFNFGPTLLSWLEKNHPTTYEAILEADLQSQKHFHGHGSALAQVYNHIIMPLANRRDKITQIRWGIEDFQHRFNRRPEGIWLAETAVDLETLELLADEGIRFTLLAPRQAARVRKIGSETWNEVAGSQVDPRRPYLCSLPNGKSIVLFFYDGYVAQDVAFSKLLNNGEDFANRLLKTLDPDPQHAQLAHIATDGESYGHHHRFGEMALAYALTSIEKNPDAELTLYGDYLDQHPPTDEVEIFENSSWSCVHGVERWRSDCGCNSGGNPGWHQKWRAPLREALNSLRDKLAPIFEKKGSDFFQDPWATRNRLLDIHLKKISPQDFILREAKRPLNASEQTEALKLLEIQRQSLLMFTSCGWFFDEISGIEPIQILQYASRAIQLAQEITGEDFLPPFLKTLENAPSNLASVGNGANAFQRFVQPSQLSPEQIAAHAITESLLHEQIPDHWFLYEIKSLEALRENLGRTTTLFGKLTLTNPLLLENIEFAYSLLHLGDHNLTLGIQRIKKPQEYGTLKKNWLESSRQADTLQLIRQLDQDFPEKTLSLNTLLRDTQSAILNHSLHETFEEIEKSFESIYEKNQTLLHILQKASFKTPFVISATINLLFNMRIQKSLESDSLPVFAIQEILDEFLPWKPTLDTSKVQWLIHKQLNALIHRWIKTPQEISFLQKSISLVETTELLKMPIDFWEIQKIVSDYQHHHHAKLSLDAQHHFSLLCKKLRMNRS